MTFQPRFRPRHLPILLLDLAPWVISAWVSWITVKGLHTSAGFTGLSGQIGMYFTILWPMIIPAVTAVWLQIRMVPRIRRLALRERREELAVTPIPARDYLLPRLDDPIRWLILPGAVNWLALMEFQFCYPSAAFQITPAELVMALAPCLAVGIAMTAISVTGLFHLLIRLCRSGTESDSGILMPIAWTILALAIPYEGSTLLFKLLARLRLFDAPAWRASLGYGSLYAYEILLARFAIRWALNAREKAVVAYYTFG